jgi:hypothetical protein
MWWDLLWYRWVFNFRNAPGEATSNPFYAEILLILRRILAIPHDACRESALHGIGHWVRSYPQISGAVDEFLAVTPGLRAEFTEYARRARLGHVQ